MNAPQITNKNSNNSLLKLNKNCIQEIFRSRSQVNPKGETCLSLLDQFNLAMTCKSMFHHYHDYCHNLPELLTDITIKARESEEHIPDGYFNFKRIENERIVVYRLYCTNLNFKKLNVIEIS